MTVTFTAADGREWTQTFSGAVDFYVFRRIAAGLHQWRGVTGKIDGGDVFNVEDPPAVPGAG